jgi:hypothetical protein
MSSFVCRHCGKVCDSRKGLVQHRRRKRYCFDRELALLNLNNIGYKTAYQYLPSTKISSDHRSIHHGYYNTQPNILPVSQSETGGKEINLGGLLDEDLDDNTFPNFEGIGEEISDFNTRTAMPLNCCIYCDSLGPHFVCIKRSWSGM